MHQLQDVGVLDGDRTDEGAEAVVAVVGGLCSPTMFITASSTSSDLLSRVTAAPPS
ncbi:hypothetical protein [Streptomyces sp. NPDC059455]|uniref:hypothetical protein n=1 Tax=Streptomyces sp. NPDC059455 TaxID=3346837 RepID=UPI003692DEE7